MTQLRILKKGFKDEKTGQQVDYTRLEISSQKNPAISAEIRLDSTTYALVNAIQLLDGDAPNEKKN